MSFDRLPIRWLCTGLLFVAACPPETPPPVTVVVRTPDRGPVEGAVVGWVCKPAGDNGGDVTDKTGTARVVVFGSEPTDCVVTVAKLGYHTVQLAGQPLEPFDVVLERSP